jgi:ABC-type lipoprotein export system ATPase subunit
MNNSNIILKISNLSCSYSRDEKESVLHIPHLEIQKGKIIFVLGASGSGKSTLLETLGLMNNTIVSGSVLILDAEGKYVDYSSLWIKSNLVEINRIRKHSLSFIFQETNLMENFTAYENICLSQMIKSDTEQTEAMDGAVKLMNQVKLPHSEVDFNKLSVNLSGGQRQRVSFVRALNTNFRVLLCDEPTGNLDEVNANELLSIVKSNLNQEKTAIIVSHDISIALKYADQIVLITKNIELNYGEVLKENVFDRKQWENLDELSFSNFRNKIRKLFESADAETKGNEPVKSQKDGHLKFKKLFLNKEGKVLFGKSNLNLWILISIISITFLAIGFANGTLNYLDKKLNDKFVNWLPIKIPSSLSSPRQVREFTEALNDSTARARYFVDTVTTFKITWLPLFYGDSNLEPAIEQGRLLSFDDPITKHLFDPDNLISGNKGFKNDHDFGIVVTKRLMDRLHYPLDAKVIYLDNQDDVESSKNQSNKFKVPIPVRAVIKEIPGRNNFIISNFFDLSYKDKSECIFNYRGDQRKKICFYIEGDKNLAINLKKKIVEARNVGMFNLKEKYIENNNENSDSEKFDSSSINNENIQTQEISLSVDILDSSDQIEGNGFVLLVEFSPIPRFYQTTENIYNKIISLPEFVNNKKQILHIFDFSNATLKEDDNFNDYLCVNFRNLDKVDTFSLFFNKTLNPDIASIKDETNIIDIDSGAINEKKNFNYISKMTWLISGLLIIFSILTISLFISNLLKTHLNKIKRNVGTYKAFGLSDSETKSIYITIMLKFIIIGLFISLVLSFAFGKLIQNWFDKTLEIKDKVDYFLLFSYQTYFLIGIILSVAAIVSYQNIIKILSKTPGDLIYNR